MVVVGWMSVKVGVLTVGEAGETVPQAARGTRKIIQKYCFMQIGMFADPLPENNTGI